MKTTKATIKKKDEDDDVDDDDDDDETTLRLEDMPAYYCHHKAS